MYRNVDSNTLFILYLVAYIMSIFIFKMYINILVE